MIEMETGHATSENIVDAKYALQVDGSDDNCFLSSEEEVLLNIIVGPTPMLGTGIDGGPGAQAVDVSAVALVDFAIGGPILTADPLGADEDALPLAPTTFP